MKNNGTLLTLLIVLVSAGLGFYGGTIYQKSQKVIGNFTAGSQLGDRNGRMGMQRQGDQLGNMGRLGNRQMGGEITAIDDKTMTVKFQDGSSKIVLLSTTTTINKSVEASTSDLQVGTKVSVFGPQNQDGSITGQNIELDPKFLGQQPVVTPASN